ncbi:MAG: PTS glucose transporter subunit IIA [Megamonas funiformis]|uniref:PTS sugar transporter subunit IIA n=2 Tax=Megamonas funiformis TaxID=437897 RepID=UPI0039911133
MKNLILTSPIPGELITLNKIKDPAFSSGAMGAGCGIVPSEGKVFAPFDAKVEVLFETKHAIGLTKCERKAPKFIYGDISSLKNNDSISLFFIVLYF